MQIEIFTFALPFFFVLAIVYGALEVSGVFGNKGVKAIISLVIAFFTISYAPLVGFIYQIMPYAAMLFIVVFFIGFILSFFKEGEKAEKDYTLIAIICGLLIIFLFSQGYEILNNWLSFTQISSTSFIMAIGLVVIIMIFFAAYKKKE